jgi:hypothetical protein
MPVFLEALLLARLAKFLASDVCHPGRPATSQQRPPAVCESHEVSFFLPVGAVLFGVKYR